MGHVFTIQPDNHNQASFPFLNQMQRVRPSPKHWEPQTLEPRSCKTLAQNPPTHKPPNPEIQRHSQATLGTPNPLHPGAAKPSPRNP